MKLPALSVVAPSGTLIARGEKRIEIRRWQPEALPIENLLIVQNSRFLRQDGETDPSGEALALVRVVEVHAWHRDEVAAACASSFEEGLLAWTLENVRPISAPFRVLAARGIYYLEIDPRWLPPD